MKIKVMTEINVPNEANKQEIIDELLLFCKSKNWLCDNISIESFNYEEIKITEYRSQSYYHGSPLVLSYVKEGCDVTPCKELAEAFSHKPNSVSIYDNKVIHNGIIDGYLYIVDEDVVNGVDIIQHPNSLFENGIEMLTKRNLKLKCIGKVKSGAIIK